MKVLAPLLEHYQLLVRVSGDIDLALVRFYCETSHDWLRSLCATRRMPPFLRHLLKLLSENKTPSEQLNGVTQQ